MILAAVGFSFVPNICLEFYAYTILAVWVVVFSVATFAVKKLEVDNIQGRSRWAPLVF
jgi:hypothetical protein